MTATLGATVTAVVLLAGALAAVVAAVVVPFVLALQRADRCAVAADRVGALSLAASAAGVLGAWLLATRTSAALPLAAVPLLLGWVVPGVVGVLPGLGRRGQHQPQGS